MYKIQRSIIAALVAVCLAGQGGAVLAQTAPAHPPVLAACHSTRRWAPTPQETEGKVAVTANAVPPISGCNKNVKSIYADGTVVGRYLSGVVRYDTRTTVSSSTMPATASFPTACSLSAG